MAHLSKARNLQISQHTWAFRHGKITPLWPQANAEAERFMRTLEKAVRAAHVEGHPWK